MEPVQAARELLPWWVLWGPVLFYLPLAAVLGAAGAGLAVALAGLPGAFDPSEHWTERARRTWPTRIAMLAATALLTTMVGLVGMTFGGDLNPLGLTWFSLVAAVVTVTAALGVRARIEGAIVGRPASLLRRLLGGFVMLLCYLPHVLVVAATAPLYGEGFDLRFVAVAAATAVLMLFAGSLGLGLAQVLRVARPAPEWLEQIVRRVAAAEGLETLPTLVIDWPMANALAYPGGRRLAFTVPATEVLSEEEIAAVAAHEVGHLTESKGVYAARLATSFLLMPLGMARPLSSAGTALDMWGLTYLVVALISILLFLLCRSLFQRMETRADQVATRHEGGAETYARALERLHEHGMIPSVLDTNRASHPHLYDRLVACGVEPCYPRPEPPATRRGARAAVAATVAVLLCLAPMRLGLLVEATFAEDLRTLEINMALTGAGSRSFDNVAVLLTDSGDLEAAEPYAKAATALSERSAAYPALLAEIRARRGRCAEAADALAEADRRLADNPEDQIEVGEARDFVAACAPGVEEPPPNLPAHIGLH